MTYMQYIHASVFPILPLWPLVCVSIGSPSFTLPLNVEIPWGFDLCFPLFSHCFLSEDDLIDKCYFKQHLYTNDSFCLQPRLLFCTSGLFTCCQPNISTWLGFFFILNLFCPQIKLMISPQHPSLLPITLFPLTTISFIQFSKPKPKNSSLSYFPSKYPIYYQPLQALSSLFPSNSFISLHA